MDVIVKNNNHYTSTNFKMNGEFFALLREDQFLDEGVFQGIVIFLIQPTVRDLSICDQ